MTGKKGRRSPLKGSKQRATVNLLLGKEGLTAEYAVLLGLVKSKKRFYDLIRILQDNYDYVIKPVRKIENNRVGVNPSAFRIIAIFRKDGTYRLT